MAIRTQSILSFSATKFSRQRWAFWFSLSFAFTLVYAWLGLMKGFDHEWIVQDDARQHVFWMWRFIDPELFPNDLIADYFQSVAPVGYTTLYRLAAAVGIHPLVFNKLLPPVLTLICTGYCFLLTRQIFPVPITAFIATLLFIQTVCLKDDIISGTPRAFSYPLLLAFLYYFSRRSLLPCLAAIALLGVFYPQCVFLCAGMLVLQLFQWQGLRPRLSRNRNDYYFGLIGLAVAVAVMLPYALNASEYGPIISLEEAKQLPDFYVKGRSAFFKDSLWQFWFGGGRSGMFPNSLFTPVTMVLGFLLPVLLKFPHQFPRQKQITAKIKLLPQLILVSVTLFALAHALLFKLHLPPRYTSYSFRIILAIASGISITLLLDVLIQQLRIVPSTLIGWVRKITAGLLIGVIAIAIIFYPSFVESFPITKYKTAETPSLYQFLQQQPKDILIASLTADTDNIPTFAQRSILASSEYAIPYHLGYYRPYRQRAIDLIKAQYSTDIEEVKQFIHKYDIDYWIIEASSFIPEYIADNRWIRQHKPVAQAMQKSLEQGNTPAIVALKDRCSVWQDKRFTVIAADCILSSK